MNIKKLPSLPVLQTKDSTLRDAFAEAYNRINAFIDATPSELGAAEETHADTHKTGGTDALSPSDIGAATFAQGHAWKANKAYAAGDMCFATDGTNNRYFECVIGGTSHATTEPTWPAIGGSVTDNTVEWIARSTVPVIPEAYTLPTATDTVLGGVKVGSGLIITDGVLSTGGISITTGTVADNAYIPLPSGYTRAQCKYAVWPHRSNTTNTNGTYFTWIDCQVDQGTGLVYCSTHYTNGEDPSTKVGTAGYLCIAIK